MGPNGLVTVSTACSWITHVCTAVVPTMSFDLPITLWSPLRRTVTCAPLADVVHELSYDHVLFSAIGSAYTSTGGLHTQSTDACDATTCDANNFTLSAA